MTKRAIINADDFGLSPGVNRGILEAFRDGVLTSTTMLVNLGHFDDAVRLARENPDLPVGIHLSLLWGNPVSRPSAVPTLVESDGSFPSSLGTLARRYFLGRLSASQVEQEFMNQIRVFTETGLVPTHVDTHKHVHCLPGVRRALIRAAGAAGIRRIRLPQEQGWRFRSQADGPAPPRTSWQAAGKQNLIRLLFRGSRSRLKAAGIETTDHFVGIRHQACLNSQVLLHILDSLPSGITEIMCHPGYVDEPMKEFSRIPPHRETELRGLKDPMVRERIAANGIHLTHYGEL